MHRLWLERSCCKLDWLSLDIFGSSLNRDSVLIEVELDVQMVEDLVVNCLVVAPDARYHSRVLQHLAELLEKLLELGLIKLLLIVYADFSSVGLSNCLVDRLGVVKGRDHHAEI